MTGHDARGVKRPEAPSDREAVLGRASQGPGDINAQLRAGWELYGAGEREAARQITMAAAARAPQDPEVAYLLGLIFRAGEETAYAVKAFIAVTKTLDTMADRTRAEMLRRLAQAHLDMLGVQQTPTPPPSGETP